MLSYLHGYHAGNFADVLKHLSLIHTLDYFAQKSKPYFYLDTHSGPGLYSLLGDEAQKNAEYHNGIGKLWQQKNLPPPIARYKEIIQTCNQQNDKKSKLIYYPGSPWIANSLTREQDRLTFCELHPRESQTLQQNFKRNRRIKILSQDGFQTAIATMPPKERRGVVLIDPPYEVKQDYERVVEVLVACHKRFATGTYAIWYPVVKRSTIDHMLNALKHSGIRNIQLFELGLQKDTSERGMTSSGMIFINPPWTLWQAMEESLPFLAKILGGEKGVYKMVQLVAE
ncbi:23S rRNA (adenine(2030)-N(6))-methyltransferase [hydrothermal vent metagenome]|uniref:23S rRNA (Adenine(2030)-N(6))-methyltransferase n=1 Tax=hydrothermal vent metagenome TaxID=652676 RepID=A0A3B0W436_9ZZZZ